MLWQCVPSLCAATMRTYAHGHTHAHTLLTAKGSACSQEMGAPHEAGLIFSGRDSGTATRMKHMSSRAMAVARITTSVSPYACDRYAPMAGLVTRLAANVADTYRDARTQL